VPWRRLGSIPQYGALRTTPVGDYSVLGPVRPRAWRSWDDLADVFAQPADPAWAADRNLVDSRADPWEAR
jgi:hypothetical protein